MSWRPSAGVDAARARASMLRRARRYFDDREVLEVSTPALSATGVTDPNINSIPVMLDENTFYLHTSPEYLMKRLLAAGYPDIYQVCRVFRGGESGHRHQPEFTMVEWYRLGFGLDDIVDDTVDLLTTLLDSRTLETARVVSYCDIFAETLSIDPLSIVPDELAGRLNADQQLQESLGDDLDAWLDLAMATRVAQSFDTNRLTVVFHYPANQASLARICPQNSAVADRFEVYLGSIELANGFVELTDPDEQLARFENDRTKRAASGKQDVAIDYDLIDALRAGLPDCAGVALGLDRLLMVAQGSSDIAAVTTFTPGGIRAC